MSCHTSPEITSLSPGGSVALIGHPNVGKSVLFQRLTGQHAIVANYPGTTVEVARSPARALPGTTVIDTPGVVTFPPHSEDERVTARLLLEDDLRAILQVGDAKNLRRTLMLTIQLAEMGLPVVLALNMSDEARNRGIHTDAAQLAALLDLPVILTTATKGDGLPQLTEALLSANSPQLQLDYDKTIEAAISTISLLLPQPPISRRSVGLLFLSGDDVSQDWLQNHLDISAYQEIRAIREQTVGVLGISSAESIQNTRLQFVRQLITHVVLDAGREQERWSDRLSRLTLHPIWGWACLAVVLYAVYWFVGVFGAGTLVGWLENNLFAARINPWITSVVYQLVPVRIVAEFLVGEYGLWTMGMTYALALILPIVTIFFLAFGVLEDSGYLPRLAVLSNRAFQSMGLNGKAVLPMVLGLGCVTMATLTTRVLETRRERLLVTLLLALAVPCSAQLGVVMGMLAGISLAATMIWGGVVMLVLLSVGWLAARLLPGDRTPLLVELPPMRLPQASNVILKTLARLEWYIKEVVPLFLIGAAFMFVLDQLGILAWLNQAGEPIVTGWLGLPPEASAAFLMGFLRRDFGATGLFVLESQGFLSPAQIVVSMVTITLLIPCIASVMVIARERGWRTAIGMVTLIIPLAFLVGGILYRIFLFTGWGL